MCVCLHIKHGPCVRMSRVCAAENTRNTQHADLRALLADLQHGPVATAFSDSISGDYNQDFYKDIYNCCTAVIAGLQKFDKNEKLKDQLAPFMEIMHLVATKQPLRNTKTASTVRSKATVQAVLAGWAAVSKDLRTYLDKGLVDKYKEATADYDNAWALMEQKSLLVDATKREKWKRKNFPSDQFATQRAVLAMEPYVKRIVLQMADYCAHYANGANVW